MKLTGENRSTRGRTCPSATLSTTNPTWTDPGSNLAFRGETTDVICWGMRWEEKLGGQVENFLK
jgi:hypothetical protein